jgi:hypothetical protein
MQVDNAFDVRSGGVNGRMQHKSGDVHPEVCCSEKEGKRYLKPSTKVLLGLPWFK